MTIISGVAPNLAPLIQSALDINNQLADLQRQLGTGQKADTYSGLGSQAGIAMTLSGQLAALGSYDNTISLVQTNVSLQQSVLQQIGGLVSSAKAEVVGQPAYSIDSTGQTPAQQYALDQLGQILNLLNTKGTSGYLFSGSSVDQPSTDTLDHILNGNGAAAGLKQIISERNQADIGTTGLGRLAVPAASTSPAMIIGSGATLTPDAAAVMTGSGATVPLASAAGGTLVINGTSIAIGAGSNTAAILGAINAPATVALTGVTASLDSSNQLVLTSADAATQVDIGAGSTAGLLTDLGLSVSTANPTNLLTQGAVFGGDTLTFTVGANPTLTVTFGTGVGQVATMAQLNTALGTLTGGTASVNPLSGDITVTAANTTDAISVGGTASAANFGITAAVASPTAGTRVSVSDDASPFGMKLASVNSQLTNAVAAGPTGSPATVTVDLSGGQPNNGDTVTYNFTLPDGSSQTLTLQATTSATPGTNQFAIGATTADTANNLQAALTAGITQIASDDLPAASTLAASNDFFGDPPMRVAGPPFSTATAQVAGTTADTVFWYTGEDSGGTARSTATARVDPNTTVSYGTRANEEGIRWVIQNIAALAATTYSASDPNAKANYQALTQSVYANLAVPDGVQSISNIEASLSSAQTTMQSMQSQHQTTSTTLQDMLQSIEGVDQNEVGAKILSLQTSLQASLSTTARLAQLSLVNYLSPVSG
jgi:flagellin-like hook-associated protein FlgL